MSQSHLFITSDQLAFFDEKSAFDHAKTLEDATICRKTQQDIDLDSSLTNANDIADEIEFLPDSDF